VSERDVQVGAILAGKYRVERVLGQGGMGVVVEATQLDLDRRVALKFLRNAVLPETSVALTRFEREARTVARLRGAHIVQVYDVGKLEHGEPFIVMELLAGEDLSVLLDRELRLSVADAVDYILQSCEAMAEAHVAGVVHRDLKPANLFLTRGPDGRALVKVLDFGISKLMSTDTSQLSLTSGVLGSPLYMSPEQLRSAKDIDHRSDVWSLGTILYELVAGFPAFQADGLPQVCARIMMDPPDPISATIAGFPAELESIILGCLQKAPEDRYPTVADLALALLPFARKSARSSAETAIRIVRGSKLAHGALPQAFDSMPPPGGAERITRGGGGLAEGAAATVASGPPSFGAAPEAAEAISANEGTINISGAPPSLTQAELNPLVSTRATGKSSGSSTPLARGLVWGGVGLAAAAAVLLTAQIARRAEPSTQPASAEAAVSTATSAAAAPTAALPSSVAPSLSLSAELASPAPIPSAAATIAVAPSAAQGLPARPRKPAVAAPRPLERSPEDLLKHR
jgi:eukaryotic-like serine/threonine-protein kinase